MNTNLIHNILNVAIALIAGITAFMIATGCVSAANGVLDCSGSWVPTEYATITVSVLAAVKIVMNVVRDGLAGLAKRQPPVE